MYRVPCQFLWDRWSISFRRLLFLPVTLFWNNVVFLESNNNSKFYFKYTIWDAHNSKHFSLCDHNQMIRLFLHELNWFIHFSNFWCVHKKLLSNVLSFSRKEFSRCVPYILMVNQFIRKNWMATVKWILKLSYIQSYEKEQKKMFVSFGMQKQCAPWLKIHPPPLFSSPGNDSRMCNYGYSIFFTCKDGKCLKWEKLLIGKCWAAYLT